MFAHPADYMLTAADYTFLSEGFEFNEAYATICSLSIKSGVTWICVFFELEIFSLWKCLFLLWNRDQSTMLQLHKNFKISIILKARNLFPWVNPHIRFYLKLLAHKPLCSFLSFWWFIWFLSFTPSYSQACTPSHAREVYSYTNKFLLLSQTFFFRRLSSCIKL